jgi:hypothetical protein
MNDTIFAVVYQPVCGRLLSFEGAAFSSLCCRSNRFRGQYPLGVASIPLQQQRAQLLAHHLPGPGQPRFRQHFVHRISVWAALPGRQSTTASFGSPLQSLESTCFAPVCPQAKMVFAIWQTTSARPKAGARPVCTGAPCQMLAVCKALLFSEVCHCLGSLCRLLRIGSLRGAGPLREALCCTGPGDHLHWVAAGISDQTRPGAH